MGEVNLSWDSFVQNITDSLKTFSEENLLTDVTLVSSDLTEVAAHKLVLCSASPVLREIIVRSGKTRPLLYLRGVKHNTLKSLLQFVYEGKTSLAKEDLNDLVEVAVDLEIKDFFKGDTQEEKSEERVVENKNIKQNKGRKKGRVRKNKTKQKIEEPTTEIYPKQEDTGDSLNRINCNKCDHISNSVSAAKYHMRVKHSNILHQCEYCHKTFSDRSTLVKHQAALHEGVRYPCTQCHYKATQKGSLREHILAIHKGIRHQCPFCHQTCYSAGILKKHISRIHHNEKDMSTDEAIIEK